VLWSIDETFTLLRTLFRCRILQCPHDFEMDAVAVCLLIGFGFALGYGAREIISRRRHREAARQRQMMTGQY